MYQWRGPKGVELRAATHFPLAALYGGKLEKTFSEVRTVNTPCALNRFVIELQYVAATLKLIESDWGRKVSKFSTFYPSSEIGGSNGSNISSVDRHTPVCQQSIYRYFRQIVAIGPFRRSRSGHTH